MISASLSILSSSSSFPSNSNAYQDASSTSTSFKSRPFEFSPSKRKLRFPRSSKSAPFKVLGSSSVSPIEDGSAEQFLRSNSIADFMRFKKGVDGGTGELQTAVVSYRKRFPWSLLRPFLQVDLVSTIHIADKEYFDALQKGLESYDCVLYEMVTSRESLENRRNLSVKRITVKNSRSRGLNILGCIQRQMARFLTLDFQLDCLDYETENWYHADLDFETFQLLQEEKGESFFSFARDMTVRSTKAMIQSASIPEGLGPWRSKLLWAARVLPMPLVGLLIIGGVCADTGSQESEFPAELEALSRLDFGAAMKVFLAKRLTAEFTQATADVEESSVIIGERNRAAMDALKTAIDKGHNKIAILYGGGHMPDLGRRLQELELIPTQAQWIPAWSIRKRDLKSNSLPFLKAMAEISGWPLNRYQTMALVIFSSVLAVDLWFWELFFGNAVNWTYQLASQVTEYIDNTGLLA